ncbi:MAG TPA: hypothetical protein VH054_15700 [Polyangiaceae bacterium]|jgi:hypothetical protein|nr:hypothetical protein [Polyangiaceae bacterium]
MMRSIYAAAACAAVTAVVSQGCNRGGVGDPCIPEQEFDAQFLGFDPGEVNVESHSFQCLTRTCLVNHFRGRVTCPYGGQSCTTPESTTNVVGGAVQAQCTDRTAADAVYCSCRCANGDGRTDDGANYCACSDGFECAQLVNSIGVGDSNLVGGYCIKKGTEYNAASACTLACDPNVPTQNCAASSIL